VTEDLTKQVDNYALYLPAIDEKFAAYVVRPKDEQAPHSVSPSDLNFLNPRSKLWTYKWCLASAGRLAYSNGSDAVSQRKPNSSWVMGDSGGYQIGTGALQDINGWKAHARKPDRLAQLWRESDVKRKILSWLDAHCDYGMTIDMPLWVRDKKHKTSPWHHCGVELLTDLTVENNRYISDNRGLVGNCQFLNVLQGRNESEEDYWYRRVRHFDFEGWAFGGSLGPNLSIKRVLRRLLIMRDEGMLGGRKCWLHILGISQLGWSIALTAVQRAVQGNVGRPFTVSFDSSTPLLWAGKFQCYPKPPNLTDDIRTWRFSQARFPVGYAAATKKAGEQFPAGSPLSSLLTVGDMNPDTSPYAVQTFNAFSNVALASHNLYVFIRAFIDGNKAAFGGRAVPPAIGDIRDIICELFVREDWSGFLAANLPRLESVLGKEQVYTAPSIPTPI
jgi:hypothetical protein